MEMSVQIVGDTAVRLKLQAMPDKLRSALLTKVDFLTKYLQRYVITQKLSGQVLNKRSGDLQRSISQQVTQNGDTVTGKVYADSSVAPYAGIHEFGGTTPPHVIEAKNGKALMFDWNGKTVFFKKINHPGSIMPERSFLRSSLDENKDYIVSELKRTVDQVMAT